MNILTLMIALAIVAGSFVVTYVTSYICLTIKKAENMLWAAMLCVAGLIYPVVFAGAYAQQSMPPSVVPLVVVCTLLASLGAHFLALRKTK